MNVLFLCTGNSARSILGEAILNHIGNPRFKAFSAGSHPKGEVNSLLLALLRDKGMPVEGLRSKSWDEFARPGAPAMDVVLTVCDQAASEPCPLWPGRPTTAHWSVEDPAAVGGSEADKRRAFLRTYEELERRIRQFVADHRETAA